MPVLPTPWPHVFLEDTDDLRWEWIYHAASNITFVVSFSYTEMATAKRRVLRYNSSTLALIGSTVVNCLDITYNPTDNHLYTITPTHVRKYNNTMAEVASYAPTAISLDGFVPTNISTYGDGVYIGGTAGVGPTQSYILKVNTALSSEPWIVVVPEADDEPPNRLTGASDGFLWFGVWDASGQVWLKRINPSDGTQSRWLSPLDYVQFSAGTVVWDGGNKLLFHGKDFDLNSSTAEGKLALFDIPSEVFVSTRQENDYHLLHYAGYPYNDRIWIDRRNSADSNRRSQIQELHTSSLSDMRLYDHLTWDFPAVNPPAEAPYHSVYKDAMTFDSTHNKMWIARYYDGVLVNDSHPGVYVCDVEPTYEPPPTDPPPPDPEDPPPDPCDITIYSIQEPELPPLPNLMDIGGLGIEPDLNQVTTELWTYLRDLNSAMFGAATDPDTVSVFLSMFRRWSALSLSDTEQPEIPPDPQPPTDVSAFGLGALSLVEWTFSRDPSIKGYEIQHSTVSDFSTDTQFVRLNGRQWVDADVASGVTKYYRVRSLRDNNRLSDWSTIVSATTIGIDITAVSPVIAGNGLSGGGGAPLSVNAGPGIIIISDSVQAHVDDVHIGLTAGQISVINRHALAGTANQVVLSASGANALIGETDITLSLPQNIHTGATPTFADLTLSGLTANRLVRTGAGSSLDSVAALSDWVAGTANRVTVADDGDGTITLSAPQDIHTGASPQFTGLNLSGLTASQLVVTDGSKNLASLARGDLAGTANQVNLSASGTGVLAGTNITLSLPQSIDTNADVEFDSLTLGDMTLGSVVFVGASGLLSQDNSNFFWDNTNKRLGIGVTSPTAPLHINTTSDLLNPIMAFQDSSPSQQRVGGFNFLETGGSAVGQLAYFFQTNAMRILTNGAERLRIDSSGNVGIGTDAPTNLVSLGGNADRTIWMERHTTANTAGNDLTVQAGGATSGATDKDGGALILKPGQPTGNARLTHVKLQGHSPATATGTGDQASIDRLILNGFRAVANNTTTAVISTTLATNSVAAGIVNYSVEVFDGTDVQVEVGQVSYHVTNKGGAVANNVTLKYGNTQAVTAGTLTVTWTISAAATPLIAVNANSSLTPSAGYPRVTFSVENLTSQAIGL